MSDNKDPHVKDQSNTGELGEFMSKFLVELRGKIQKDDDDRLQWKNKMITAVNQRLGIKRYSNWPYPGAPDVPLPETDKLIKKQVPNLVLSAWSPKSLCEVKVKEGMEPNPEWDEKAKKCTLVMNQLLRSKELGWFKKLCLAADYAKQHGHCIFKVREEFRSRICNKFVDLSDYKKEDIDALKKMPVEALKIFLADRYFFDLEDDDDQAVIEDIIKQFKSGEEVIEFDYEEIDSFPTVDVPLPTKVIVPCFATEITSTPRLTYEYFLSVPELEMLMDKKIFRKIDLKSLSLSNSDNDIVEAQKQRNEGLSEGAENSELFRIHECYTYFREGEGKPLQRWVFTFLADCTAPEQALLQDIPFPYEFSGWNFEKWDNELKDTRYYSSRGTPEQIRAYQEVMERSMNNMLIRDEMNNTPMWEVLSTSELLTSQIPFVPGQKLPVKALGQEIAQIGSNAVPDVASANILQLTKAYVEEYQSSNDQFFRNPTNMGGGKTLGEINTGIQNNSAPLNLEVISFNETLSNVYQKMFEIMKERMGESIYVEGQEVTKEDFNFPAEVRSNGELEVANQTMMAQKSFARLNVLLNPGNADIVTSEDRYNSLTDWLEKDGVKSPDKFCTHPREVATDEIAKLQAQIGQMKAEIEKMAKGGDKGPSTSITFKDLPTEGKIQLAGKAGIQLTPESINAQEMMTTQPLAGAANG